MNIFQDHLGNWSSFRVVWVGSVAVIVLTWAIANLKSPGSMAWPLDGVTTAGIFAGPGLKTLAERKSD